MGETTHLAIRLSRNTKEGGDVVDDSRLRFNWKGVRMCLGARVIAQKKED